MKIPAILTIALALAAPVLAQDDLGNLSDNPYAPDSSSGLANQYNPNSVSNPYGTYGSPYSNKSATNPYATDPPKLYDDQGNYHGKLSANQFDPDSTSNQFGRYGSQFSPDSINNQFGAGSPYTPDSPNNQFGHGMHIEGDEN